MNWSTIITIILGSSLLGTVLTTLVGLWIKQRETENQASFLALSLAHLLEEYAHTCISAADDHRNSESSGGHIGKELFELPRLPPLPEGDYRVFDLDLLDKIFDFKSQTALAGDDLAFAIEMAGQDASAHGYELSVTLGRDSLRIADTIREHYTLKRRSFKFGSYSLRQRLKEHIATLHKRATY